MADHTTMATGDEHPDHDLYGTSSGTPTTAYGDATQGSGSSTGEATRRDKAERKAKGDTMFKAGIGLVVLAFGGAAVYKFLPQLTGSHVANRPQPVSAIAVPVAPASAVAPGALSGVVSPPVVITPTDSNAPALGNNAPTLGTAAVDAQAPGLAAASAPSETIAPLGASMATPAAPVFATPASSVAVAAPSLNNAPSLNSAPSLNVPAPVIATPVIATPVIVAQAPIDTSSQAGLARALNALTSQLSDLKTTIQDATTQQDKKIDDLSDRVARLEQGRPARGRHATAAVASTASAPAVTAAAPADSASATAAAVDSGASAVAVAPAVKPAHRYVRHHYAVRARHHAAPASAKASSSDDSGVLFDKGAAKAQRHDTPDGAANTDRQFSLQATIPGRLWIKNNDGSSSTFGVGDELPDGSRVQSIDADNYSVRTSRGVLH